MLNVFGKSRYLHLASAHGYQKLNVSSPLCLFNYSSMISPQLYFRQGVRLDQPPHSCRFRGKTWHFSAQFRMTLLRLGAQAWHRRNRGKQSIQQKPFVYGTPHQDLRFPLPRPVWILQTIPPTCSQQNGRSCTDIARYEVSWAKRQVTTSIARASIITPAY